MWAEAHCRQLGLNQRGDSKAAICFASSERECLLVIALYVHKEMVKTSCLLPQAFPWTFTDL